MPMSVGSRERKEFAGLPIYAHAGDSDGWIYVISNGSRLDLKMWALTLDEPAFSADGTFVCGTVEKTPTCYLATVKYGIISISSPGSNFDSSELPAFTSEFAQGLK
ncbi:hypothetical protein [Propioniciclava flava]|uniref:Uncharacterized protein n=1 Tax=Propioniciclava flava TaxID=2072026 RepID=A0A4Q2EFU3_9ACTN|nr:hypothetical protein [Propioniciclava flava]RXW32181.1 hypothetical protein C1706_09105 [Propioniciclava flava]